MAGYDLPGDKERIDHRLMRRSPVRLFHDLVALEDVVSWLASNGYHVVDVDASWTTSRHMFADLASAFPACCHDNFQCLHEGLAAGLADALDRSSGVALVLRGFDTFATSCWTDAQGLIDLVCEHAWQTAVGGRRFVTLVQTDTAMDLPAARSWAITPWHLDAPAQADPTPPVSGEI
ncbi:hypothetical protein [Kineosporia sp. A_224]|uniref:hypothetical protein n=1 Tax=Kineosporia sp. A_224 TaxID=1962180 RepID=UPI00117BCD01|nr:hypothetical protein [Kineosporia sp. A_224]